MNYHCAKCKRAWLVWTQPKSACTHSSLEFGCKLCIKYLQEVSTWNFFHAPDFKIPTCGDCGKTMMCYDKSGKFMEFGCPMEDQCGDMICDEDKALASVEVG